tara:strand:+ start:1364 stop:1825 length:462 start_codon:yes stop_codon:yes gene_type:complete
MGTLGMAFGENQNKKDKDKKQKAPQTKREINKEARLNKQANRKVDRKYKPEDVKKGSAARQAAMDKERKGMDQRRERGKQFFIDMARASVGSGEIGQKDPYTPRQRQSYQDLLSSIQSKYEDNTTITVDNPSGSVKNTENTMKDIEKSEDYGG